MRRNETRVVRCGRHRPHLRMSLCFCSRPPFAPCAIRSSAGGWAGFGGGRRAARVGLWGRGRRAWRVGGQRRRGWVRERKQVWLEWRGAKWRRRQHREGETETEANRRRDAETATGTQRQRQIKQQAKADPHGVSLCLQASPPAALALACARRQTRRMRVWSCRVAGGVRAVARARADKARIQHAYNTHAPPEARLSRLRHT